MYTKATCGLGAPIPKDVYQDHQEYSTSTFPPPVLIGNSIGPDVLILVIAMIIMIAGRKRCRGTVILSFSTFTFIIFLPAIIAQVLIIACLCLRINKCLICKSDLQKYYRRVNIMYQYSCINERKRKNIPS